MNKPSELYNTLVTQSFINPDPIQLNILPTLDTIHLQLQRSFIQKLSHIILPKSKNIQGLYLWGHVGSGKTFLMDLLIQSLPNIDKKRWHFHEFSQYLYQQLEQLKGQKDPLKIIAKQLHKQVQLICLDEFHVHDISDASILSQLLEPILATGITLVTTSNSAPNELYLNGLQRNRFLPTIELINTKCMVHSLNTNQDYRANTEKLNRFIHASSSEQTKVLNKEFQLTNNIYTKQNSVSINNRTIHVYAASEKTIWFNFLELCSPPRSKQDYITIAKQYEFIFISHIPQIQSTQHNIITNFIHCIDIFYDQKIKIILGSEHPLDKIYPEGKMSWQYMRTKSRLTEMLAK